MTVRIVAVADTHLFHEELAVPGGDVFVHAGDLCQRGDLDELRRALDWIRALPHATKVLVAGNHDFAFVERPDEARALVSDMIYLQDTGATTCGFSFWGSPWQPEYNDWAFNLPRGHALAEKWALVPDGVDVLITHGPPLGIGDRGPVPGRLGCEDLLERVRRAAPRLHLFGHIHQDGGAWREGPTLFANVTTWECERAPTVIDLDEREARAVVVPSAKRNP
jgi:Icc-related predicted phosphoesterase